VLGIVKFDSGAGILVSPGPFAKLRNQNEGAMTTTVCIPKVRLDFHPKRHIDVRANAPSTSSDGGLLLLRQADEHLQLCDQMAPLLSDRRDAARTNHSRLEQLRQRVFQIALGYADQNDASSLRHDPLWKVACDRLVDEPDALSSQPSLSRLEHAMSGRAIVAMTNAFEDDYVRSLPAQTTELILDIDATDDPTHGQQPLSFFNGHYDTYMYFPLLVFDAEGRLVSFRLRPGNAGGSRYATPLLARIVTKLKTRFPQLKILIRADGGFSVPRLYERIEQLCSSFENVHYVIGLPLNSVLKTLAKADIEAAASLAAEGKCPVRVFNEFRYGARSWKRTRRVIVKAEHLSDKSNPRFVLTSLQTRAPIHVYEQLYCPRGQAENAIKDFKRALAGDRLSATSYLANAFRLFLHAMAYRLLQVVRATCVQVAPVLGKLQFDTIRLVLLKVAAMVEQSARRIVVRLPASFPQATTFFAVASALSAARAPNRGAASCAA
jgi:Transposase DDE domain group 1